MRLLRRCSALAVVGAVSSLVVFAAPASAEVLTATQTTDVTIPALGQGAPYPSTVLLEGADGNLTDVNITVRLSHTVGSDIDLALVSPDGDSTILMSDVCSNTLADVTFVFDSQAVSSLSEGSCFGGTFLPTNSGGGDNWPAPGPGSISNSTLNAFIGEDPNGPWKLYVVDDLDIFGGTILEWSVTVTTETAEIVIPGIGSSGIANPYPSTKVFETPPGQVISDLNLRIPDFNHLHPDDVDMLLAGPRGASTLVMSDACGSTDIHDYEWIFDDEAPAQMTDDTVTGCNPFSIKPTDFVVGEVLPAPAPAPPYGTTLSAFDDLGGGAFSLFVNDDAGGDTGFITSWELKLTTRDAADTGFATPSVLVAEGGTARLVVTRSSPVPLGPATIAIGTQGTATAGSDFSAPSAVEFARGESTKTIDIPIVAGTPGEPQESLNVVLSSPQDDARLAGATTAAVTILADPPVATSPSNVIGFGKFKRNVKKGTARLTVKVPGPGLVSLSGKKVKAAKVTAAKAGNVALPVKAKGKALKKLQEAGSVQLTAKVTFAPSGGTPRTVSKKLKLTING